MNKLTLLDRLIQNYVVRNIPIDNLLYSSLLHVSFHAFHITPFIMYSET